MIAVRPWSFPASAMPIIVTVTYLFWRGAEINWLTALWVLLTMVVFHSAGNTWSDYFDHKKKVDADDTFGAKTLTTGMFEPKEIKRLALGLLAVGCLSGIGLVLATNTYVLWCGLAGAVLALGYPLLKYNALGDLDIVLTFAAIPTIGTAAALTGVIDWSVLWIALPVGLITDGILHSNNTRDVLTDKRAGITTMAMALGGKFSSWLYAFEMIFPFIWVGILSIIGIMPLHTIIVFMTIPVAVACQRTMKRSLKEGARPIADLDVRTANLQLVFSTLLTIAFVSAKTKQRVQTLLPLIDEVHDYSLMRVPTNVINEVILDAQLMTPPPTRNGQRLKIYYASQVSVAPPTFVVFVNDPELMHFSYNRFLENKLREAFSFTGTTLRILPRERER